MMTSRSDRDFRPLKIILLLAFALLIFFGAFQKQHWDSDIFWALKSGEWIVNHMSVPLTDPFSYTFPDKEWIDFTWGFQVLAYIFFTYLGGWGGLMLLQLALTALTFYVIYKNLKLLTTRTWLALALLFLVYANVHVRLIIRPQLVPYLMLALYFYLLTLYIKGERRSALLIWLLLPLQVIWVNFHSSFVLGIFITGAYAIGEVVDERISRGLFSPPSSATVRLALVSLMLPFVSIINPYGVKLVIFPFIHMGGDNADALKYIWEWLPINLKDMLFNFYPLPIHYFAAKLIFYGTLITFLFNLRRFRTRDIIMLAPVIYMAVNHIRWLVIFVFFAAPVLARNMADCLDARPGGARSSATLAKIVAVFMIAFLLYDHAFINDRSNFGLGLKKGYFPKETIDFMKANDIKGNIYNDYVFGGILIFNYPELKVFIDGRTPTVYSSYHFWTSRRIAKQGGWKRLETEQSLTLALVGITKDSCEDLWKLKEWVPVNFDDASVLFLKKGVAANTQAIEKWGLESTNPCDTKGKYELTTDTSKLALMRSELKDYNFGWGESARPHRLIGLIDTAIGGKEPLEEALTELRLANDKLLDPLVYYDIGMALVKLERFNEAINEFRKTLDYMKDFDRAYYGMGLASYYKKDYHNAYTTLLQHVEMSRDKSEDLAYRMLGMSAFHTGKYDISIRYLKRAAFISEDNAELAGIYYFLGNSLLETGKLKESGAYYKKAIKIDAEYINVLKNLSEELKSQGKDNAYRHVLGHLGDKI